LLFNSFEFAVFFIIVVLLYFALPFRYRWLHLLISSYIFYMSWRWEYIFLIVGQTVVNFYCGHNIARSEGVFRRKVWLTLSLVWSLGLLFFYKYCDFARRSLEEAGAVLGMTPALP